MALHSTGSRELTCIRDIADQREFIKISQAVGMGFLIMVRNSPAYRAYPHCN